MIDQAGLDALVTRVQRLVDHYGGGSPELEQCRQLYDLLHRSVEPGAFGLLEAEVERLEREIDGHPR